MPCNLLAVIPGPLAKAMPITRHGTVGVVTHRVPCSSHSDVQKPLAFKTKTVKSTFVNKSPAHSSGSHGFVHAKSRTRIGCWNVRTLGSLSEQSAQLRAVLDTMKSKNMDLLTLAESHWPGSGVSSVCDSTILHSCSPSSHTHGVVIILSPRAKAAWDAAHIATWFRNDNRLRHGHMIDHVLVNKRFCTSVLDTRVYRSTFHESDHNLSSPLSEEIITAISELKAGKAPGPDGVSLEMLSLGGARGNHLLAQVYL